MTGIDRSQKNLNIDPRDTSGVVIMKTELERLFEEKQALQTQLVQVQSMLYLIDYFISEELLREVDMKEKAN